MCPGKYKAILSFYILTGTGDFSSVELSFSIILGLTQKLLIDTSMLGKEESASMWHYEVFPSFLGLKSS